MRANQAELAVLGGRFLSSDPKDLLRDRSGRFEISRSYAIVTRPSSSSEVRPSSTFSIPSA